MIELVLTIFSLIAIGATVIWTATWLANWHGWRK